MECNKDEAARAKEIAETKFKMKDIVGAKKFALKAQSLYPEMEGISQMVATFDVYIAAENKVNVDVDWYGILNASPSDDNETLKRKYKKLALVLHPDKNDTIGAEGAFKHIYDAWKFLSDKNNRAAYDRRRSMHSVYQKVSVSASNHSFCHFVKTAFTENARTTTQKNNLPTQRNNPRPQKNNSQKPVGNTQKTGHTDHQTTTPSSFTASGSSDQLKTDTFRTVCRRCMMQYEYQRVHVNCNLLCANCLQPYMAVEVPKPSISSGWSSCSELKRNLDPKSAANHNTSSDLFNNTKWTFSRTSSPAHAASVVKQAFEKVKKEREQAQKKNAKRKNTTDPFASGSSRKKRKVRGESDVSCSGERKVRYYPTGETRKMMRLQHGTKNGSDKLSPRRSQRKISKEDVTR